MFHQALNLILEHEGRDTVTDDGLDPGGVTRWGISQRAYPNVDIRSLTFNEAANIYHRDYWVRSGCDMLPPPVALCVFDAAVNQGVGTAIRLLQEAAGVKADGVLGPVSVRAVNEASDARLITKLMQIRARRYLSMDNDAEERFEKGWINRLLDITVRAMEFGHQHYAPSTTGDWHYQA